jgi:pimeloyl-ACP methyl ester carboxylesterase
MSVPLPTVTEVLPNGRRLRVARLGHGPPLVLLHGYPENLQIWCELAPRLADRFEVIAPDWPGQGESDAWPGGATPSHMADRLRQLLDWWDVDRVSLVGADMGGQPALAFAARYPKRTSRLVVMNSLVFGDEPTSWEIRVLRRFGWNRFILRSFPRSVFRRAERTFLPRGVRLPRPLRDDFWQAFGRREVRGFISKMCAGYQGTLPDLPAMYSQVTCPTLALWGGRDRHFPPRHAERLHAAVPNSRLHVIPAGEHWMSWHMPDEVAARIREFMTETESQA